MNSAGFFSIAAATIAGTVAIWGIWHQRLGRLGRIRLVKEQIELLNLMDERFDETAERAKVAIANQLRTIYPPVEAYTLSDRIFQILGGLVGAGLYIGVAGPFRQDGLNAGGGVFLGLVVGVGAIAAREMSRIVRIARVVAADIDGWGPIVASIRGQRSHGRRRRPSRSKPMV